VHTLLGRLSQIEWEKLCSTPAMPPIAPQFCVTTHFHQVPTTHLSSQIGDVPCGRIIGRQSSRLRSISSRACLSARSLSSINGLSQSIRNRK
jgi:hypothetical protein